ncbi:MAG: hypothetical protein M1820_005101 [Bogoriella megaspora]|nr:MAG: hypothetical protein M1820_005101 [Bogoriella megaspora]
MHLRPMTRSDLYDVGEIGDRAFGEDAFWRMLTPYMDRYPNDRARYYRLRARGRLVNKEGAIAFVVVTDENDADWKGKEELAGYSFWERKGTSKQAEKWQSEPWYAGMRDRPIDETRREIFLLTSFLGIERSLLAIELYYERFVNRAVDWKKMDEMGVMLSSLRWDESADIPESWHAHVIACSPKFRRRGVGTLLLNWGLERAREEGIPVLLQATPAGKPLYEKAGFDKIAAGASQMMTQFVTTEMLWEPEDKKGQFLTEELVARVRDRLQDAPITLVD